MPRTRAQHAAFDTDTTADENHAAARPAPRSRRAARKRETQQLPQSPAAPTTLPAPDKNNDDDRLDVTTAVVDVVHEPPPPKKAMWTPTADARPQVSAGSVTAPPSSTSTLNSSSIPDLTTNVVRKILTAQRRALQADCCLDPVEEVYPGWTRLEFNFRYTQGTARNRHAKHQRDSARAAASVVSA